MFTLALAAMVSGCLTITDQPCSAGGQQCPRGYSCSAGQCLPVGNDGSRVRLNLRIDEEHVDVNAIRRIEFESFRHDSIGCRMNRDPDNWDTFNSLNSNVFAEVQLGDDNTLRVPAGRHLIVVSARGDSDVIARGCAVVNLNPDGDRWLGMYLVRANGDCGDNIWDYGEQCDDGPDGSALCTNACESLPITVQSGSGCITEPTIDCTGERCLIGWVENGSDFYVRVRHPDGSNDNESNRGLDVTDAKTIRSPRIDAHGDGAAVVWIQDGTELSGAEFNHVGQRTSLFTVSGDPSLALMTLVRYINVDDRQNLYAGWISSDGNVLIEQTSDASQYNGSIGHTPLQDLSADFYSSGLALSWSVDSFDGDADQSVVAAWLFFSDEGPWVEGPVLVPDHPENSQSQPTIARSEDHWAFVAWTDENNALDDQSGSGIRGRVLTSDDSEESFQINTSFSGNQTSPVVARSGQYIVVAWNDEGGALRARYYNNDGYPLLQPFGYGQDTDFLVDEGTDQVGKPVISAGDLVYFLWLEDGAACASGGNRLILKVIPPPLH